MINQADIYTDLQGLNSLRQQARNNSDAALREVAGQMESVFVQMMIKSMRDANLGEGIFESDQSETYTSMFDQQLALDLSKRGGMGLADVIVRQLGGGTERKAPASQESLRVPARNETLPQPRVEVAPAAPPGSPPKADPIAAPPASPEPDRLGSAEEFVQVLWPHAKRASQELGVTPELLLAQAALETGWGKGVIRHDDGRSSYNLFNIKADARWGGDHIAKQTIEFQDGVAVQERAAFRAYDSYAESFADYVNFLKTSPRYQDALDEVGDRARYMDALQNAGYATDPKYALKVLEIVKRTDFEGLIATLKSPTTEPLT